MAEPEPKKHLNPVQLLRKCARRRSILSIVTPDLSLASSGVIVDVTDEFVQLAVPQQIVQDLSYAVCVVTLSHADGTLVFIGQVVGVNRTRTSSQITLEFPNQFIQSETRGSFRVPIFEKTRFVYRCRPNEGHGRRPPSTLALRGSGFDSPLRPILHSASMNTCS